MHGLWGDRTGSDDMHSAFAADNRQFLPGNR